MKKEGKRWNTDQKIRIVKESSTKGVRETLERSANQMIGQIDIESFFHFYFLVAPSAKNSFALDGLRITSESLR